MAMDIFDSHIHLFPERLLNRIYRWFDEDGWQLPYAHTAEKLIETLRQEGVSGASALLYAHRPGIARDLNQWLSGLAKANPWLVPFGTVHPEDEDLPGIVRECLEDFQFAGIKVHCNVQRVCPDDPRLEPLFALAEERQVPLVIHASLLPYPDEFTGADRFRLLMQRHPSLRVQVAHLGADEWEAFFDLMDRYPGIHMDTCWIGGNPRFQPLPAAVRQGIVSHADRILFGSDLPIMEWPYAKAVEHLSEELLGALGPEGLERVFAGNARRFLGLTK